MKLSKGWPVFLQGAAFGGGYATLLIAVFMLFGWLITMEIVVSEQSANGALVILLALPMLPGLISAFLFMSLFVTLGVYEPTFPYGSDLELFGFFLLVIFTNAVIYGLLAQLIGWVVDRRRQSSVEATGINN